MPATLEPDRLLEGENPRTLHPQDARHWLAVYREMIGFKDDILERVHGHLGQIPAAGLGDVLGDIKLIENQLQRYQRRMEFWYAKQWELEGLYIDHPKRMITYRERSIKLTRREVQIFLYLASRSPRPVPADSLLRQAWHDATLPEESMRTYIGKLRRKLSDLGGVAQIVTTQGSGYSLVFAPQQVPGTGGHEG